MVAVIFDVDGTLIDSNDAHAHSWAEALSQNGFSIAWEEIRRRIGMGGDNLLPDLIGEKKDSPVGKKVSSLRDEIFKNRYLPTVQPFDAVPQLFQRIHENGLRCIISSSSNEDQLQSLLKIAKVEDLVDATVSESDVKTSKPAPDAITVALKKAGCSSKEALMIGDSPYDIASAQKAGVQTVAVRCGGFSDEDLAGAIAIYDDPADLLRHFAELPFEPK
jgi:phosphoglycolate phosphatase-like HAD superfamily hydrolase